MNQIKCRKTQAGFALIWVLVLLLVAGLVLPPLLILMTTGIRSAHFHEDVMLAFYAADAGVEDGAYKVQYNDPNLPQDTGESLSYTLDEDINDYQVDVTIENLWILAGLETDEHGTTPHEELVTVGQITELDEEEGTGTYWIEMTYDASLSGELKLDRVGAWLPPGFSYVQDSSGGITSHEDVPDNPTESDFHGGAALVWDFDSNIKFEELPPPGGGTPGYEFPIKRILYFKFTPAQDPEGAFSWMRTNRQDVYLSWDVASGTYKVTSTAGETTIESYVARAKLYDRVSEVWGDYRAIGQSNMIDSDGDSNGIRDTLLFRSDAKRATLNDIPDDAHVEAAYLYWSAWRRYPTDISGYSEGQVAELADEVNRAKFWRRPSGGSGVASWVTADRVQILPNEDSGGSPHGWSFSCFADVTDLITWNGNGKYKVKKIENPDGITTDDLEDDWSYAGWSLLIIYSHPDEDAHQLYLYDDFLYVDEYGGGTERHPLAVELEGIEGFLAPEDADGRLTVFVGEGDDCWNGDKVKFNDNYLPYSGDPYDGVNPQNDVWNGKSSGIGGDFIDGVDIDTFDVSPYIDSGDASAEVKLITGTDSWNLVYVILSFRTVPGTETGLFPVRIMTYTYEP